MTLNSSVFIVTDYYFVLVLFSFYRAMLRSDSAVIPWQVVCLSVCDVEVSWSHVGIFRK